MAIDVQTEIIIGRPRWAPRSPSWRGSSADGSSEMTYIWEDNPGGGTVMKLRNRGEPSGFSSVAAPMMASAMRRANQKDLARLKAVLEEDD